MVEIGVYKIGKQWYDIKVDRNSGLYENKLIKSALTEYYKHIEDLNDDQNETFRNLVQIDKLVLIGGVFFNKLEEAMVKRLMSRSNKIIFVMTDIDCLDRCKDVIEASDIILTQSPVAIPEIAHKPQKYSYVPELFFKPDYEYVPKTNCVLFGGTIENREDDAMKYLFKRGHQENGLNDRMCLISRLNGKDARLEYSQYMNLLSHFKFSLIISHEKCRSIGWVTSRYVESISCYTIPLIDVKYDVFGHFKNHFNTFNVENYDQVIEIVNACKKLNTRGFLQNQYNHLKNNHYEFIKLIDQI